MAMCLNPICGISAQSHIPDRNKCFLFKIPEFHGLSCFHIAHHELLNGLFSSVVNNSCNKNFHNFNQLHDKRNQQNPHMLYEIGFDICKQTV